MVNERNQRKAEGWRVGRLEGLLNIYTSTHLTFKKYTSNLLTFQPSIHLHLYTSTLLYLYPSKHPTFLEDVRYQVFL
jgi:hypothetical protein